MPKTEKKREGRGQRRQQKPDSSSEEDPSVNPELYKKQREKNNEAVKKSRERTRRHRMLSQKRVGELERNNEELRGTITELRQELSQLKDIFMAATTGASSTSNLGKEDLQTLLADKPEHEEVPEDESKYDDSVPSDQDIVTSDED